MDKNPEACNNNAAAHAKYIKTAFLTIALFLMLYAISFISGGGFNPKFDKPTSFCVTPDESKLIFFDSHNARILITNDEFKLIKEIKHSYFSDYVSDIWGVSLTDSGEIALPNNRGKFSSTSAEEKKKNAIAEVLFFNFDGSFIDSLSWESEKGPIILPVQATWLGDGTFWIADVRLNYCVKLNRKGEVLKTFGKYGKKPGELYFPQQVIVTADGNLLVCDTYNSRLQLFSPEGSYIKTVAEKGEEEGKIMFPQRLATDRAGNIYCSELETMRISVFDKDYRFIKKIIPKLDGDKKGEDVFFHLNDMHMLEKKGIFLALDQYNSVVHVFDKNGVWIKTVDGVTP